MQYWSRQNEFDASKLRSLMPVRRSLVARLFHRLIHDSQSDMNALVLIIKRIGTNLKSLRLPLDWNQERSLASIAQYCPTLEEIRFYNWKNDFRVFGFWGFFRDFHHLKILRVPVSPYIVSILRCAPASLEIIEAKGWLHEESQRFESPDEFLEFFRTHLSLTEVRLSGIFIRNHSKARIFPIIAEHCQRLKKLELIKCDMAIRGLTLLEAMIELTVEGTGELLSAISTSK